MSWQPILPLRNELFEANLQALLTAKPSWKPWFDPIRQAAERIECYGPPNSINGLRAPNRMLLDPTKGQKTIREQARRLETAFQQAPGAVLLTGIGLGYGLIHSLPHLNAKPETPLICVEPDIDEWTAMLVLFDLRNVLQHERILLFPGTRGTSEAEEYIEKHYLFIKPISYQLGTLPADRVIAERYLQLAERIAKQVQTRIQHHNEQTQHFFDSLRQPQTKSPQSVWCCMARNAYIHYPIAKAFMRGFEANGIRVHFKEFDPDWKMALELLGDLIDSRPEMLFFVNFPPKLTLQEIGITKDALASFQIPMVSAVFDDTLMMNERSASLRSTMDNEWCFSIDRSYLSALQTYFSHTAFLPAATMFETAGTPREEFASSISYVGSIPDILPYLQNIPAIGWDVLNRVEGLRSQDYTKSFLACFRSLDSNESIQIVLQDSANAFCEESKKLIVSPGNRMEYFLYGCATYIKRKRIVERLLPIGLKVFGPETWKQVLGSEYAGRYGGVVQHGDLADCYASAALSLNIHSHQCPTCFNPRDFDVPMAGGVVIGDWVEDAEGNIFTPGKEILLYRNEVELPDLVQRWLADPNALGAIRQNGRRRVAEEHTYTKRVQTIMQTIA